MDFTEIRFQCSKLFARAASRFRPDAGYYRIQAEKALDGKNWHKAMVFWYKAWQCLEAETPQDNGEEAQRLLDLYNTLQSVTDRPDKRPEWQKSLEKHLPAALSLSTLQSRILQKVTRETAGRTYSFQGFAIQVADFEGKHCKVEDGIRRTIPAPLPESKNTVYILGDSHVWSPGVEDKDTLASCLQRVLNKQGIALAVKGLGIGGSPVANLFLSFMQFDIQAGDWIILCANADFHAGYMYYMDMQAICREKGAHFGLCVPPDLQAVLGTSLREKMLLRHAGKDPLRSMEYRKSRSGTCQQLSSYGLPVLDPQPLFDRPHKAGEVFQDNFHTTKEGNVVLANAIWSFFFQPFFAPPALPCHDDVYATAIQSLTWYFSTKNKQTVAQIQAYTAKLPRPAPKAEGSPPPVIGAIVMNANPFTKGHQYLAEYAAQKVDTLYVFVVEEDRSFFPFADRFRLIQEGLAHLGDKVLVMPSGEFIISSITFPGYFTKDTQQTQVDPSHDVMLFGLYIAPALGISRRFVGEEPTDFVTRQYNETMEKLLPRVGVQVEVIPRKTQEFSPEAISASLVRRFLEAEDWESIRPLVPETTYHYLRQNKETLCRKKSNPAA